MRIRYQKKILLLLISILLAYIQNIAAQVNYYSSSSANKISTTNRNWHQGGIFNGEYPEKEILAGRTEHTKKFDKGNAVVTMIFGGPFHFKDNIGGWQDINLDVKPQVNGVYAYINDENKFISRFAKNANDGVKKRSMQRVHLL